MSRRVIHKDGALIYFHKMLYPRDSVEVEFASKDECMSMDIDLDGKYRTVPTVLRNVLQIEEYTNLSNILVNSSFLEEDEAIVNFGSQIAH